MAKLNQSAKDTSSVQVIKEPRDEDVLCGKEKHCVSNPGSVHFRSVIEEYASKYQEAVTKQEKMKVTKEIYDAFQSENRRFLKFDPKADGWVELSSLLARDKCSHALRFANREKKAPSTSKPKSKRGHRRTGSDSSASTLTTAATELTVEDFDYLMDDEPLDWDKDAADDATNDNEESKPYAYPIYDSAPAPAAYPHGYCQQPYYPHPHHAYGHGYYHTPQSYHHSYHYPQQYPAAPPAHPEYETSQGQSMKFPEKPLPQPPARESSMDVDLTYMMSEPLMDWDLETDQVFTVNEQ